MLHRMPRMNTTQPNRTPARPAYGALLLFFAAYVGVLAIIFAPAGSLSTRATPLISSQTTP